MRGCCSPPAIASWRFKESQLGFDMSFSMSDVVQRISFDILVAPLHPPAASEPRKQLQVRAGRASFNDVVNLVRFARVLAFTRGQNIYLGSACFQRPHV